MVRCNSHMGSELFVSFLNCKVVSALKIVEDSPKGRESSEMRCRELAEMFSVEEIRDEWLYEGGQDDQDDNCLSKVSMQISTYEDY